MHTLCPRMFSRSTASSTVGILVFTLWLSVLCMRSKAWLAARGSRRRARLPRTASSAQRSRRLRCTRAAAPVLLAHAEVTKSILFFQWVQSLGTRRYQFSHSRVCACAQRPGAAARELLRRDRHGGLTSPAFHACGSASPFRAH